MFQTCRLSKSCFPPLYTAGAAAAAGGLEGLVVELCLVVLVVVAGCWLLPLVIIPREPILSEKHGEAGWQEEQD